MRRFLLLAFLLAGCVPVSGTQGPNVVTLAEFGTGQFLESVVQDRGMLYVTSLQSGRIFRVGPDGSASVWATLPVGRPGTFSEGLFCLAPDGEGGVFVNLLHPDVERHGIWHVDPAGAARRVAALPPHVIPNGLARHSNGDLYLADSAAGAIWRLPAGSDQAELWSNSPLLLPRAEGREFPAANGLQVSGDWVYATVSDTMRVVRVPIRAGRAGDAEVVADGIGGDDFAIDDDGTLYVTTHPFNSVVRISPDGSRATIAGPEQNVVGPTAATIGLDRNGRRTLFVVTDGGLYRPLPDGVRPATLLAISLPQ